MLEYNDELIVCFKCSGKVKFTQDRLTIAFPRAHDSMGKLLYPSPYEHTNLNKRAQPNPILASFHNQKISKKKKKIGTPSPQKHLQKYYEKKSRKLIILFLKLGVKLIFASSWLVRPLSTTHNYSRILLFPFSRALVQCPRLYHTRSLT